MALYSVFFSVLDHSEMEGFFGGDEGGELNGKGKEKKKFGGSASGSIFEFSGEKRKKKQKAFCKESRKSHPDTATHR